MPERLGIVGLPNAGKSSLFNALTGGSAVVASHPFSTTETNVGVAQVPDQRLLALAGEVTALEAAQVVLEGGTPLYRSPLDAERRNLLKPFFLLTNKPLLAVVNLGEDQVTDADAMVKPVADELGATAEVLGVSVQ